jgi:hypothetical protein
MMKSLTVAASLGLCLIATQAQATSVSVADVSVTEGNSGTTNAVFTVILTSPISGDVTLTYQTFHGGEFGSANSTPEDIDYIPVSGLLDFTPSGPTSKMITVLVNGDTDIEPDDTFTFFVQEGGFTIGQVLCTIVNDDLFSLSSRLVM